MREIQSLLKLMSEGLKTLAEGVETLAEKVEEVSKAQFVVKPEGKKPSPAAPKKKPARRAVGKAPGKKPAKAATAADTVLSIISRSKKGVNTAAIMEKTGYGRKKVANIIYKLGKQGKIKSIQKGVYVKG